MESPRRSPTADHRVRPDRHAVRPRRSAPLRVLPPRSIETGSLKDPSIYINRELSWIEFNESVLQQARDSSHPLLERVKFLAITATNLDEFYMIRVSTTLKKLREGIEDVAPDGHNTEQQLDAMRLRARRMLQDQVEVWNELRAGLIAENIRLLEPAEWTPEVREFLSQLAVNISNPLR